MMEVKDVVEYLNNEGFETYVNDYGVTFVDVTKYGMNNSVMVDIDGKQIISETPIHEEVDKRVIKPLMLMLGLTLIDYPSGKRYTPILINELLNTDVEYDLLDLMKDELRKDYERQD